MNTNPARCLDCISGAAVVAGLVGWLPPIAAFMSIVWIGLQIYWGIADRRARRADK